MMEFWKTKQFKDLNCYWNEKLKEAGFEDAETEIRGERALKQKASNSYRQASEIEKQTRLEYYLQLSGLTQNTNFENEIEALILTRHSEGALIKEIVEEIKLQNKSLDRKTIRHIIRRWQMNWGVRCWSHRQMNLKKR